MSLGTTAIKFEEDFFEDVLRLFNFYKIPSDWFLRITSTLKGVQSPIDGTIHPRPVFGILPPSEQTDEDIVHEITLTSGGHIRVITNFQDLRTFAAKEEGIALSRDAALLEAVKQAIIERKQRQAW